jgi:transposase InsO family protein
MPWKVKTLMSQRREFVRLAQAEGINFSQLCKRFAISRKTGYKWLKRFGTIGDEGLADRSRRPHNSPHRTAQKIEQEVCKLRDRHPTWGGRKLNSRLKALGHQTAPAPSTITEILRRHQQLDPQESEKHQAWRRFEHPAPNDLWQMDFKGDFALERGRCYPLTALDDHSRFALILKACADQETETVRAALIEAFRRYGLPRRITMDNGVPWGTCGNEQSHYTVLTVWLLRIGVMVTHSRPHHPQTQGKDERFHRTLGQEVLRDRAFRSLSHCQTPFDRWREIYNCERPHEAIGMAVPASRYQVSQRAFPESLPELVYPAGDVVRCVNCKYISYQGRRIFVGRAFAGQYVALRPTTADGIWEVRYAHFQIGSVDLRDPSVAYHKVLPMSPNMCYP